MVLISSVVIVARLLGEQLGLISKRFELQRISRGIKEEHGRLFADETAESNTGIDDKRDPVRLQALGKIVELLPRKHDPEMRHRHVVSIDRVVVHRSLFGREMTNNLVTEEVEIDPLAAGSSFGASKLQSVEGSGRVEIGNRKRKVKRLHSNSLGSRPEQVKQSTETFYVRIVYMELDPRRLRVLLAVVRAGGVVEAGRALNLTPQAVSLQMTALEREAGVTLFDRSKRRLTPTRLATELAGHAERIEAELVAARRSIATRTGSPTGTVRIAAFQSAIRWLVADALPRIRRDAPGVIPEVIELSGQGSEQALRGGSIDLVIDERDHELMARSQTVTQTELRGVHTELIRVDPYQLVAPAGQGHSIRSVQHALELDWIAAPEGAACHAALHRLARNRPQLPRIVHTCLEFPAVLALVAAGEGVALIPSLGLVDAGNVETCRVSGLGARHLMTVQRTSRRGTEPAVDAVVAALR